MKYRGHICVIRFFPFSCECNEPHPAEGPARSAEMTFAALASNLGVDQQRDIWSATGYVGVVVDETKVYIKNDIESFFL